MNLGINPLKPGDLMVTSGAGGYYRPGVAVAVIIETTPDGGIARLVAEPSATNYVAVEPVHQPEAVSALMASRAGTDGAASPSPAAPPSPSPSPSPSASPSPAEGDE